MIPTVKLFALARWLANECACTSRSARVCNVMIVFWTGDSMAKSTMQNVRKIYV